MTITITLPRLPMSADLRRALRALWPLAVIALPAVAEAAGASLIVRLALEIAVRMTDQAIGA
ncbi:MAG: hypothetical protein JWQ95_1806 [Sphaerisporangium sp.]|jgi:hypothetical protein|nr:hypothetical protein [Sphaerisporangium sp.]